MFATAVARVVLTVPFADVFFHVFFTAVFAPEDFTVIRPASIKVFRITDGTSAVVAFRPAPASLAKPVVFFVISATFSFSANGAFFIGVDVRSVAGVHVFFVVAFGGRSATRAVGALLVVAHFFFFGLIRAIITAGSSLFIRENDDVVVRFEIVSANSAGVGVFFYRSHIDCLCETVIRR
jgi:hypothetical protein